MLCFNYTTYSVVSLFYDPFRKKPMVRGSENSEAILNNFSYKVNFILKYAVFT